MKHSILKITILFLMTACGYEYSEVSSTDQPEYKGADLIKAMKPYCESCHKSGGPNKKFWIGKDSESVWTFITTQKNLAGRPWIEEIIMALDWPEGKAPGSAYRNKERKQRYMPMGKAKQAAMAKKNDAHGMPNREYILEGLKALAPPYKK